MKNYLLIGFIGFLSLTGCNPDVIVDQYHSLPETGWHYKNEITDTFQPKTNYYHQLYANVRINGDYGYSNLYTRLTITAPDSSKTKEVINLKLAENSGKWLGSGIGDVITFQIPILGKQTFKQKGTYTVNIEQYMRLENLPNVVSVGIKVEQLEEIY